MNPQFLVSLPRLTRALTAFGVLLCAGAANAATFNIADGDVTALKAAITTSNSNGQSDVINLAAKGNYSFTVPEPGGNGNALPALVDDVAGAGQDLVINGNGATLLRAVTFNNTTSANMFRFLDVVSGVALTVDGLVLRNGSSVQGGAIRNTGGTLLVRNSAFDQNSAFIGGGAISHVNGTLTVLNSSFSQNIIVAVFSTDDGGGAILNSSGNATVRNSTFSRNSSQTGGAAIGNQDGTFSIGNTILFSGDGLGSNLSNKNGGTVTSLGYNLSDDNSNGLLTAPTDQINTDPLLADLGDNGGPTPTLALRFGSPAVDKGKALGATTDQRGLARPFNDPAIAPAAGGDNSDIGAFERQSVFSIADESLIVTTTSDEDNGTSNPTFGSGTSLREAIGFANAKAGADIISFNIAGAGPHTITPNSALPNLGSDLSVSNTSGESVTIARNNTADATRFRIFNVDNGTNSGPTVSLRGLNISGGRPNGDGGGLFNRAGTVTITSCTFRQNLAEGGGGLLNDRGTVTINNSTFSENIARTIDGGGAILNKGGAVTIFNSTLSENLAPARSSAPTRDSSYASTGTAILVIGNSIIHKGPASGTNFAVATGGTVTSQGYNLCDDNGSGLLTAPTDQINTDPLFADLGDNGGPTLTRALRFGSPAVDKGKALGATTDQRGLARPFNDPGIAPAAGGDNSDIGAFERQSVFSIADESLIVTTTSDEDNGTSNPTFGNGTSLREALIFANSNPDNSAITFDPTVFAGAQTIALDGRQLVISSDLSIIAPAAGVTLDAMSTSRGFSMQSGRVTLTNLSVINGNSTNRDNNVENAGGAIELVSGALTLNNGSFRNNIGDVGGALSNASGTLTLNNCVVDNNRGVILPTSGGGIYNLGTLVLNNSVVSNNNLGSQAQRGAGLFNSGTATITGSTFEGNRIFVQVGDPASGTGSGGGINNAGGTLTVANSTFRNNRGGFAGGGIFSSNGTLTVTGCTFVGNSAESDSGGALSVSASSAIGNVSVTNSTFSQNTARIRGGAIEASAFRNSQSTVTTTSTLALDSNTFSQNTAPEASVLSNANFDSNSTSVVTIRNTIFAGDAPHFSNRGTITSQGNNLSDTDDSALLNQASDRNNTDARLGTLADNGGPTLTILPQSGSPAIDAGATDLTVDQRGLARPDGAADDIGATEGGVAPVVPLNFGVSILPKAPKTNDVLTATPVIANASGVTFSYVWSVNGTVRPNETARTFDLSKPGNGDKGDRVSVVVSATRGNERGTATNFVNVFNSAPTANNATASGAAGALISVPVAGADTDGDAITFKRVGGPVNGTGSFSTTNGVTSFNYSSRAFFNGVEEIRFVALDNEGKDSAPATIRITVSAQPRVIGFGVSLIPFGPRSNTVLTAQPLLGDANSVTFTYQWSVNGVVRPGETGQTLDLGKPGNGNSGDTVSVVVTARRGIDSGTATNSALIVSAAPVANDAVASGNAGAQIVIPISGSDADGDAFTFKRVGGPRNGTGEFVTAANGSVTFVYRSRARFNGTETIRFVAIQADGRSSIPATITIAVTSSVPDIGFGVRLTPFGPTTNQTLTASLVITNASGVSFTYAWSVNGVIRLGETTNKLDLSKPGNGDRGDTVTAIVTARRGDSVSTSRNSTTVFNTAPTTQNASASGVSGAEIRVRVVGFDADRDALTFKSVGGPRNGTGSFVTDAGGNTTFVYRSRAGFVGTEEIRFVAVDPVNRTSTPATISINVTAASGSGANAVRMAPSGGGS